MPEAVITGLGPVAPNGVGKDDFWEAISSGKSGIRSIKNLRDSNCHCQIAGNVPPEMIADRSKNLPEWVPNSKNCHYSVIAALLALEDAGLAPESFSKRNAAVYMGVSNLDMEVYHNEYKAFYENRGANPESLFSASPHTPATVISNFLKISNDVITFSTSCTSGAVGINLAADIIISGKADIVIAGGVDASLSPVFMNVFSSAGLSPTGYNGAPEKASRPFDEDRESGILSEGAGIIILEEKNRALLRKANIYASFSGAGMSSAMSPFCMKSTFYDAMSEALNEARLKPADIDYISACGPGHPMMDRVETKAIKSLYESNAYNIPISSIKSMIGNPGAAAGPLQIIAAALSIDNNYVPPTVNLKHSGKGCDLDYVPVKGRVARVNRVMVNLRGLGGGVSSIIISRPDRA